MNYNDNQTLLSLLKKTWLYQLNHSNCLNTLKNKYNNEKVIVKNEISYNECKELNYEQEQEQEQEPDIEQDEEDDTNLWLKNFKKNKFKSLLNNNEILIENDPNVYKSTIKNKKKKRKRAKHSIYKIRISLQMISNNQIAIEFSSASMITTKDKKRKKNFIIIYQL